MRKLKVLVYPDVGLRQKARPVTEITDDLKEIAHSMVAAMYQEDGIGLAATQVGIPWRILVIDLSDTKDEPQILINPVITERIGKVASKEGCLSFPGIYIEIPRAEKIVLTATDLAGEPIHIEASDLLSRCLQHEVDHLDGIVFTDHLSPLKRRRAHQKVLDYNGSANAST